MMLVDTNLLIYAVDRNSAHHAAARMKLERVLSETTQVGLAWKLAFLKFTTHPRIMRNLLAIEHGYCVYSTDHDFKRFSGLKHVNPLV